MKNLLQDLFNDILNFFGVETFVDFVIFTRLINRGKVWMQNEKVSTWVVFNWLLPLWSLSKVLFLKTMIDMKLNCSE